MTEQLQSRKRSAAGGDRTAAGGIASIDEQLGMLPDGGSEGHGLLLKKEELEKQLAQAQEGLNAVDGRILTSLRAAPRTGNTASESGGCQSGTGITESGTPEYKTTLGLTRNS